MATQATQALQADIDTARGNVVSLTPYHGQEIEHLKMTPEKHPEVHFDAAPGTVLRLAPMIHPTQPRTLSRGMFSFEQSTAVPFEDISFSNNITFNGQFHPFPYVTHTQLISQPLGLKRNIFNQVINGDAVSAGIKKLRFAANADDCASTVLKLRSTRDARMGGTQLRPAKYNRIGQHILGYALPKIKSHDEPTIHKALMQDVVGTHMNSSFDWSGGKKDELPVAEIKAIGHVDRCQFFDQYGRTKCHGTWGVTISDCYFETKVALHSQYAAFTVANKAMRYLVIENVRTNGFLRAGIEIRPAIQPYETLINGLNVENSINGLLLSVRNVHMLKPLILNDVYRLSNLANSIDLDFARSDQFWRGMINSSEEYWEEKVRNVLNEWQMMNKTLGTNYKLPVFYPFNKVTI